MLSDTTSACQCWKQAPLNGQIYDSQLPQKIFLWLPAEGIYKGWEKCSILQYIVILSRMIMSQCRWVINWNSKTEISLPAATFSLPAAERYRKRLLILCCTGMRTKHTCASCLCLSGDRMAAMASTKPIRPEPTCKLMYGSISSSMKSRGELTRTTVCKVRGTQHFSNMTNLRNHLAQYHPELGEKLWPVEDASQRTIRQLQPNWESIADYQIHRKFYYTGFKTKFSCGERGVSDDCLHSRSKTQNTMLPLLHWHSNNDTLQWN